MDNVINTEVVTSACKSIENIANELASKTTTYSGYVDDSSSAWSSSNAATVRTKVTEILNNIQEIKKSIESVQNRIQVFAKSTENIDSASFNGDVAAANISGSVNSGPGFTQTRL